MFGISIGKLLVLAVIIGAVWYGYKWLGRNAARDKDKISGDEANGDDDKLDLVQCPDCGAYGPRDMTACPEGKSDCPMVKG